VVRGGPPARAGRGSGTMMADYQIAEKLVAAWGITDGCPRICSPGVLWIEPPDWF
jgi:hypothetical protein